MKIFFLLIFFIPLPFKFSISYYEKKYNIKFYIFTLIKNNKFRPKGKRKKKFPLKTLLSTLFENKYKPLILITGNIEYSLSNPMITAIFYGILFPLILSLSNYISKSFKILKYKIPINVSYKEKLFLKFNFNCIIFLSLVQIIIILLLLLKNIILK